MAEENFGEFGEFLKFAKFNPPIFKNIIMEDLIRQSFTRQNAAGANSPKFSSAKVLRYTVCSRIIMMPQNLTIAHPY